MKSLVRAVYNGNTIMTIDDETLKKNFVNVLMNFKTEVSDVALLRPSTNEERNAKKFVMLETDGVKYMDGKLFIMFPEGTEIYVYKT
jgi:hypothetical protein